MSSDNRNDIYKQIIDSIDIAALIGEDIELSKKGNNFVGLCPFHSDNNPSFTVSPDKKIYKCFVCGEGGNVITYYQKYHKISHLEALRQLAKRIGIVYNTGPIVQKAPIHYVLEETMKFYNTTLSVMNEGRIAKQYLHDRGYANEDIDFYNIGYASSSLKLDDYLKNLGSDKFGEADIGNDDLFNQDGSLFFNNRLMIPIMDDFGRVVGFSGRTLTDHSIKYMNSREKDGVFQKGKILYNLNNAKEYIQNGELIIVEGFFDVFALRKMGYNNVIATMGTAFTFDHIKLFQKYNVNKFIFCFDGDIAGINATLDAGEKLIQARYSAIRCVNLKEYKDIDESIKNIADFKLDDYITTFVEYKIEHLEKLSNLNSLEGKKNYINKCLEGFDNKDETYSKLVASTLSKITDIDMSIILELMGNKKQVPQLPANNSYDVQNQLTENNNYEQLYPEYDNQYIEPQKNINVTNNMNSGQNFRQPQKNVPLKTNEPLASPNYVDIIIYMLTSFGKYNEIIDEIKNRRVSIDEIIEIVNLIKKGYEELNINNDSNFSLLKPSRSGITLEFYVIAGISYQYQIAEALKIARNDDLSARELVDNINNKAPGIGILKLRSQQNRII